MDFSSLFPFLQGGAPDDELLKNLMGGAGGALGGAQTPDLPNPGTAFDSIYNTPGILSENLNAVASPAAAAPTVVVAAPPAPVEFYQESAPTPRPRPTEAPSQIPPEMPPQGAGQVLDPGRYTGEDGDEYRHVGGESDLSGFGEKDVFEDYNLLQQGLAGLGLIDDAKPLTLAEQKLQAERQKKNAERSAAMARASQAIPRQQSSPKRSFSPGSLAFMPKAGQLAPIYGGLLAPRRG